MIYVVTTMSGSTYTIEQRGERWYLRADNVPNPNSVKLDLKEWEIHPPRPWPIRVGFGLALDCIHVDDRGHPDRMPGGGKHTSPVIEVVELVEVPPEALSNA